jgi:TM2 domain-containing membrane protein YozV
MINDMNAEPNTHSKLLGYLLWIFGFTGAHRFYYGKPISGTIWFFSFGLLGIGWLIDLFLIPSMDRKADHQSTPGPLDYSVAWILMVFLGFFGAHRLYMHKWVSGLFLLALGCLSVTGMFFFIPIIAVFYLIDLWTINGQVSAYNRTRPSVAYAAA